MSSRPSLRHAWLAAAFAVAWAGLENPLNARPAAPAAVRDPGVPPQLRAEAPGATREAALASMRAAPRTRGEALAAQVRERLRASFDAADVGHRGRLTREQARAGGFGYVARHFDEIDRSRAAEVSFDDLLAYLRDRQAAAAGRTR